MNVNQVLAALYLVLATFGVVAKVRLHYWKVRLADRRLEVANIEIGTLKIDLDTARLRAETARKERDVQFHLALNHVADQVRIDQEMTGHRAGPGETLAAVRLAYAALTGINWWPAQDDTSFANRQSETD